MGQFHDRQIVAVQAAERRVQADIQVCGQRVVDAVEGIIVAVHADQLVMDLCLGGIKGDLHRIKAGGAQILAHHAGQHPAVGVQPGHKPLGRLHQLDQIMAQRRLAANDRQPLVGVQLRHGGKRLVGCIAVQAFLVAVPRAVLDH